jgi:D-beta-D-heptose 7-phosphate kinase/D-beta-D-heptose 1-phosphate adenosyltransferase
LERAARQIVAVVHVQGVVITLDKEGAYLFEAGGKGRHIPTRPRAVYDVSGAGDAVLAMLAVAIAEKCPYEEAVALANVAGGLEVERLGVVAISRQEVLDELYHMIGLRGGKVLVRKRLAEEVGRRRLSGETIVFTNGCFDLLHMGHIRHLRQARELGSCLIVAINSDGSTRRLKGKGRPIIPQAERAEMLGALECVDYVTVFDEDTPEPLLELIRPDVLVKGGATSQVVGRKIVERYGGRVLTLDLVEGWSTTEIINRIQSGSERG